MNSDSDNVRALVISTNKWPSVGQVASGLALVGFQVAVVCPIDSPAFRLRKLHGRFPYRWLTSSDSVKSAIAAWSPDVLVCADDAAVRKLHDLYYEASKTSDQPNCSKLINLIELSLGDHRSFATTLSKTKVLLLAKSLGITCPPTTILSDNTGLSRAQSSLSYPIMVKADVGWGGLGVRLANDQLELYAAITELSLPQSWPGQLKHLLGRSLRRAFFHWLPKWPQKMTVQQYIVGRPCTCSVVCWKGKVLAGITFDVLATSYQFGPSTVLRLIEHPDITAAAEKLAASLELSGFLGLDFILDPANNAWFLEMNARATPTCHIITKDHDLAGSLFTKIAGSRPTAVRRRILKDTMTLFPAETAKAQKMMPNLSTETDEPDDEPEYVAACRAQQKAKIREWVWYSIGKGAQTTDRIAN